MIIGKPEYLTQECRNYKEIARMKCGNLEKANRYWETEENKICDLCREEKDTLKHLIEKCNVVKNWKTGPQKIEYRDLEKIWEGKNNNEIAK